MNVHRVRKSKSLYDNARDHIFLEVEKNRWLEIESLDGLTHDSIETFLDCEVRTRLRVVGFTDQNFQWGTIKDWIDSGIIKGLMKPTRN
jgi:hypothetical protein